MQRFAAFTPESSHAFVLLIHPTIYRTRIHRKKCDNFLNPVLFWQIPFDVGAAAPLQYHPQKHSSISVPSGVCIVPIHVEGSLPVFRVDCFYFVCSLCVKRPESTAPAVFGFICRRTANKYSAFHQPCLSALIIRLRCLIPRSAFYRSFP